MANAIQREEAQRIRAGISFDLYSANAEQRDGAQWKRADARHYM